MKLLFGVALIVSAVGAVRGFAQPPQGDDNHSNGGWRGYQRHASDGNRHDDRDDRRDRRDFRRNYPMIGSPQVSAGWFQRPYPYHLDYYKMRYGGSYAPYFGNLYGPSVYPAYYGPYYGGYGGGFANGYGQPGYGGVPLEFPADQGLMAPGAEDEQSQPAKPSFDRELRTVERQAAAGTKSGGEVLPVPAL